MAALVLGLVVATAAVAAPDWMDCPTPCRCKWSSGKKTALCREAGFTSIPGTLDEDIQVLDLSGNAISKLSKSAFENVGLIHLQRIYLSNAGLTEIHRDAFRNLTILIEVDLSHNDIREFHPMTFRGNERLRVLYLSGNPLTKLVRAQFPPLPHLRTLELEGCNLEFVHKDALIYLAALETLNLKYNLLRNISEATFVNLANLKTLLLDSNPWRCDCDLRGFRNWFLNSKLYSLPLLCYEPLRLTGKHWGDVPPEEFACPPQLYPYPQLQVQAEAGGRITFGCRVTGDPIPEVSWLYDGYPINRTWIMIEAEYQWTNVSVNNVSESDVGTYTCLAKNLLDTASMNFSLVLPEVVTATTVSKSNNKIVWWGLLVVSLAVMFSAVITITAVCCVRNKNLTQRRNLKASVSFTDQEKKLLDVSIATTTDRGSDSCEALGPEVEMIEPPVHITIEREPVSSNLVGRKINTM
ncbi:unnamed protein product [Acanthoscelides obtectus]|uniref:Ig-like domain-containing protein n=1 Tax=Acanthoscelides obtectus TaxID=200917 RepID=A0A9P0M367_ACAOB|nr:unnamed protein product [Acanthoscelides obtectus]CAH2003972.1 unnamed protein product [Acanthoscelides obtectus]CAK1621544.1 Leucine-rich repeat-containing protein 24 [Acanthoscelides obtectus]CAK1686360.1 Leucine-rich repeat-containing protein 24 [Acanthoscelides obtectus]